MKIKAILLFFIISALAISVSTASAAINIIDAEAVYDMNLSSVSIPTNPYPLETVFVINADTSSDQNLSSVSIPTQPSPLKEIFIINEDASFKKNLSTVSIITAPSPLKEIFIINEDARAHEKLSPKDADATPPDSITNLQNVSYASNYINWTWVDPADIDFSHVIVYIDGNFKTNVQEGIQFYNATGFAHGTAHTISTRTVDTSGNINQTWVSHNAATLSTGEIKGDVNRNGRRDTGDATLILRSIVGLPIPSQYLPILPVGDMNCNNKIDTGDATLVLRSVVNLPIPRCWE